MIKENKHSAKSLKPRVIKASILLLALAFAGCASPNKDRFYQLSYALHDTVSVATKYDVILDSITVPDAINRPQLVVQKSATESQILDEQRWISPLDEQIRQAVQANLQAQLPQAWLSQRPQVHVELPRYFVHVEVEQLQISSGQEVAIEMTWVISDANRKPLRRKQLRRSIALSNGDYASIAPAISKVLMTLSENIANDIKDIVQTSEK